MEHDGYSKDKGLFDKYWWATGIFGLLAANWSVKNSVHDELLKGCRSRGLNVNCTCIASQATERLGPFYVPLLWGGASAAERDRVGREVAHICMAGG